MALANALPENSGLRKLAISDNYVGSLGAVTIANALAKNSSVESLAMAGCELGDEGVERLCDALLVRLPSGWYTTVGFWRAMSKGTEG